MVHFVHCVNREMDGMNGGFVGVFTYLCGEIKIYGYEEKCRR